MKSFYENTDYLDIIEEAANDNENSKKFSIKVIQTFISFFFGGQMIHENKARSGNTNIAQALFYLDLY